MSSGLLTPHFLDGKIQAKSLAQNHKAGKWQVQIQTPLLPTNSILPLSQQNQQSLAPIDSRGGEQAIPLLNDTIRVRSI